MTTGSSAGFVLAFLALFDVGAKVALPSPGYPCYRHILTALGQSPGADRHRRRRALDADRGADRRRARRGRASPAWSSRAPPIRPAPCWSRQRLAEIAAACRRNGVWLDVGRDLSRPDLRHGRGDGAGAQSDDAIVVNSFSKYFSMTGWRIGWLVVPPALVRPIERLAQNLYISPPAVAQVAALGAFDGMDELEANRRVYAENRALLLDELPKLGLDRIVPADGAFYLYVDVGRFTSDSLAFSQADAGRDRRCRHARRRFRCRARLAATSASATQAPRRTWRRLRAGCEGGAGSGRAADSSSQPRRDKPGDYAITTCRRGRTPCTRTPASSTRTSR